MPVSRWDDGEQTERVSEDRDRALHILLTHGDFEDDDREFVL